MATALNVRGFNPIWAEFDLTGKIFDDTYWMYTLENTIPYIPQPVYHDPTLANPWTDPIQFLANGTLPVDVYWLPDTVYRLEFRQNNGIDPPSQSDPLIYEVDNYMPGGAGGVEPITNSANTSENEIANPQFAVVNFTSPTTISGTNPAALEIAPGWVLNLSGTGTVVLNQVPLNSATIQSSNAPYALRLTLTGWNPGGATLVQKFQQNGVIWANKFISTTISAFVAVGTTNLVANLVDSQSNPTQILAVPVVNQNFQEFTGGALLPASTDTDFPPSAYMSYVLTLPNNVDLYITSIQLLVQDALDESEPAFVQDTVDRQIDHLFHYYNMPLQYKQNPSFLVGWDFPFNPAQFFGDTVAASGIGANKSKYVWDQTIIFQSANSGVGVTRGAAGELVLTAAATTQMAIVQYLDYIEADKILNSPICVNVSAKASTATVATVSLWYTKDASLPLIGSNNSIVLTLDANGLPATENGTWFQVPRPIGNAQITIGTNATTNFNDYALSGWDMQGAADVNLATFFAIVIGTASVTMNGTVSFNSVSLQSGSIPTRPSPKSYSATLLDCQYYFQKSFLPGTPAGNIASAAPIASGPATGIQVSAAGVTGTAIGPQIRFVTPMRATPSVVLYSAHNATPGTAFIYNISNDKEWPNSIVNAAAYSVNANGFVTSGDTPAGSLAGDLLCVHWTANALLGVV